MNNDSKATGIPFTAPMVRATLAGTLRVLFRPMEIQPPAEVKWPPFQVVFDNVDPSLDGTFRWTETLDPSSPELHVARCPLGGYGDRLWVQETWKPGAWRDDGRVAVDYQASPELTRTPWINPPPDPDRLDRWVTEICANGSVPDPETGYHYWEEGKSPLAWRSATQMPRWASRLTLTIRKVRPVHLHDVTNDGAIMAGFESWDAFRASWVDTYGQDSWDANDWVWEIGFGV